MFFCYLYYAFLMVFVLIFPDFPLPPSANNINNKAHKINKTSNGKKFFFFFTLFSWLFSCALKMFSVYLFEQFRKCNTHTNTCVITFYALRFTMSLAMYFFGMRFVFLVISTGFVFLFFIIANKYLDQSKKNSRHGESATQRRVWKIFFFHNIITIFYVILLQFFFCFAFTWEKF